MDVQHIQDRFEEDEGDDEADRMEEEGEEYLDDMDDEMHGDEI